MIYNLFWRKREINRTGFLILVTVLLRLEKFWLTLLGLGEEEIL